MSKTCKKITDGQIQGYFRAAVHTEELFYTNSYNLYHAPLNHFYMNQ